MSTFLLYYWISLGAIVLLTAIIKIFFRINDEDVSISYVVFIVFLGAIPYVNFLVAFILITMVVIGIFEEYITPKY